MEFVHEKAALSETNSKCSERTESHTVSYCWMMDRVLCTDGVLYSVVLLNDGQGPTLYQGCQW